MSASIGIIGLTKSQIEAIVEDKIANSSIPAQAPEYATPPLGFQNGQFYRNTSDGKLYVMTPLGFKALEVDNGILITDLSGNILES